MFWCIMACEFRHLLARRKGCPTRMAVRASHGRGEHMAKTCTDGSGVREHFTKEALRACQLAREAAAACAELVRNDSEALHERIASAERELDAIDHDLD